MVKTKTARTLPQQVASIMAKQTPENDWQLMAEVIDRYYNIIFERKPATTGEIVAIMQHLPTFEQIGRARRTALKKNLISEWRDFYDSPIREAERIGREFSNIPYEYQRLDERDEL